ncbi:MAG: metallophosphoesterase [Chlorobiaceae bacterium]|nr:metallophosphoesterase [Chlorobiaceae bacterium]
MAEHQQRPPIRFALIADIHYAAAGDPERDSGCIDDLQKSIAWWNQESTEFLLQLGDLIKGSSNHAHAELRESLSNLGSFQGKTRHIIGNHCLSIPENELIPALDLQTPYYAFSIPPFRFIILHGMDVSTLTKPRTKHDRENLAHYLSKPELHDYCGAIGEQQTKWLRSQLKKAEQNREQVIVASHFPLHTETTDTRYGLLWNHREILKILLASPTVKVCISGHYHYGGYTKEKNIHLIVLPAFTNRHLHPGSQSAIGELTPGRLVIRDEQEKTIYDLPLD